MIKTRLRKLQTKLTSDKIEALLVSTYENIYYLSGFLTTKEEREGYLLITPRRKIIITDGRKVEAALRMGKPLGYQVKLIDYQTSLSDIIRREKVSNLGFEEEDLRYQEYRELKKDLPQVKLTPVAGLVETLRKIKDESEIKLHQQAIKITDLAFKDILSHLKPGVTEREIALKLENLMKARSAEGLSFPPIVASGAGSAIPHYQTGSKKIKKGEVVLMDFGCTYKGYMSDMTRCVFVGSPPPQQSQIYQKVLDAQIKALREIRGGMTGIEADNTAREAFRKDNLETYFTHGLGHGVGLEIHEAPKVNPKGTQPLQNGMVFSVEPGLYFPGQFGIRIEDLVTLKDGQIKVLTSSPKSLISV